MQSFEHPANQPSKTAVPLAFRLEKDDLAAFYATAIERSGGGSLVGRVVASKFGIWAVSAVVILIVLGLLMLLSSSLIANFWFLTTLILFVALAALLTKQQLVASALLPHVNGPTLGRRSYEIEKDGLVLTIDGMQQAFMWQTIEDVYEDEETIYLFVDSNMAHIFPKNVFPSPVQAQEFAAYTRERVSLAKR